MVTIKSKALRDRPIICSSEQTDTNLSIMTAKYINEMCAESKHVLNPIIVQLTPNPATTFQ